jgi:hypothetical protein
MQKAESSEFGGLEFSTCCLNADLVLLKAQKHFFGKDQDIGQKKHIIVGRHMQGALRQLK